MNPQQNRNRGKRNQSKLAKRLEGKNIGITGKEDVSLPLFSVESKERKRCAVFPWFAQAKRNCPEGKTPLLHIHLHGQRRDNDLLCMSLKDWEEWYKSPFKR